LQGAEVVLSRVQGDVLRVHVGGGGRNVRAECLDWLLVVGQSIWIRSCGSTRSTTTGIARTGRCSWSRQTQPVPGSSPKITQPRCTGVTCSAVSCTSIDKLHEHICAPYGPSVGVGDAGLTVCRLASFGGIWVPGIADPESSRD